MIQIEIKQEQLQSAFQIALDDMLKPGNYNNPVKKTLDDLLGYSGSLKGVLGDKIKLFLETQMDSPEFQSVLGKSIAEEMARRAVDSLEKKDKR